MNKAFVREPDATTSRCPRCGSAGTPVLAETLRAQLRPEALPLVSETAHFCPHPTCEVAYFDDLERLVEVSSLAAPVFPKDPVAPICPCFGVTLDDVEDDARAGVVQRIRDLIAKSRTPEARCRTASPTGCSCVAEVQRAFLRARETS